MTQTALVRAVSKWGPRIILLQLLIIAGLIWILWTFNQNSVQGCELNNATVVTPLRDFAKSAQKARAAGRTPLDQETAIEFQGYVDQFQSKLDRRCEDLYKLTPWS